MSASNDLLYLIALTQVKQIGPVSIRNLIGYCGSAQQVFAASKHKLLQVPGIDEVRAEAIKTFDNYNAAEKELSFIQKHNIQALAFYDATYPLRLKQLNDAPALLYFRGTAVCNAPKTIGIVGTRKATAYGKMMVEKIISDIAHYEPTIVSGLAYGIDIIAHKAALEHNLNTIGVLAYGLNTIYPSVHRSVAEKMIQKGGLITEYRTEQKMQPEYFADRNKIIAAMCDAVIVVESAVSGGALITAQYAAEYNRDVFAVPGRSGDEYSAGCNALIKNNKASLLESANDLVTYLRWDVEHDIKQKQRQLFVELDENEQELFNFLKLNPDAHVDVITMSMNKQASKVAGMLLELEIKGVVLALPGKRYRAVT